MFFPEPLTSLTSTECSAASFRTAGDTWSSAEDEEGVGGAFSGGVDTSVVCGGKEEQWEGPDGIKK